MQIEYDVREFHSKFGHPHPAGIKPPAPEWVELRKRLILEEAQELVEAIDAGDLRKIAREAVDLVYVAVGTLVAYGIKLWPIWQAVHRANMAKEAAPPGEKPRKPEGWVSPDDSIKRELYRQGYGG